MFVCGELVGLEVLEEWWEDEGGGGKCGCVDRVRRKQFQGLILACSCIGDRCIS